MCIILVKQTQGKNSFVNICLLCLLVEGICLVVCYGGGGVVLRETLPEQIPEFMSDSCAPNIKISDYVLGEMEEEAI